MVNSVRNSKDGESNIVSQGNEGLKFSLFKTKESVGYLAVG